MADLTPRTRSESFLNGEDLEPITRREHFYAGRENELPEGHQEPETREEWFIQKYREAGDVTVESLSITENGTYTAPSGKAYSPVSVNVPLPSNAYLLKSIEHESMATFADGTDNFVKALEVAIEPQQEGSGDPSPENIRPISGWDECKVTVADDAESPTTSHEYTINLNGTRYGGKLDVVSGVLTVDRAYYKYINVSTTSGIAVTDGWRCNFTCPIDDINRGKWSIQTDATPIFNKISIVAKGYGANEYTVILPNVTSKEEADAMLEGLEICYKLATPLTIQLTPTIIKSLQGANNFFASTGEIERMQYWGR